MKNSTRVVLTGALILAGIIGIVAGIMFAGAELAAIIGPEMENARDRTVYLFGFAFGLTSMLLVNRLGTYNRLARPVAYCVSFLETLPYSK